MRTITCDICEQEIDIKSEALRIEVGDGVHPHNGSGMTRVIDVCARCAARITDLRSNKEFADLVDICCKF